MDPLDIEFLGPDGDTTDEAWVVRVAEFDENVTEAERVRSTEIKPRIEQGEPVVLDFAGIRAPTQSFIHALLYDAFGVPGSLLRLSFRNCTPAAREVVKAVAAYAKYKQIV